MVLKILMDTTKNTNSKCLSLLPKLRRSQDEYDVVFRCRTEITYDRKITDEDLNSENLVIPYGTDGRGGYQDSFAFGPRELMTTYMSLYHYVPVYANAHYGQMVHPEYLLKHHQVILMNYLLQYLHLKLQN